MYRIEHRTLRLGPFVYASGYDSDLRRRLERHQGNPRFPAPQDLAFYMLDGHKSACVSKDGVHYWFRKKELGQMKALGFRVYEIQAPVLWRSRVTEQVVYDATKVKKRRWVRWDGFGV